MELGTKDPQGLTYCMLYYHMCIVNMILTANVNTGRPRLRHPYLEIV